MCGIVGYYGTKDAVPLLLKGLKRLEYRGYDSAGLALLSDTGIKIMKKAGKVIDLERVVDDSVLRGIIGIGHTRWATHGEQMIPTPIHIWIRLKNLPLSITVSLRIIHPLKLI